MRVSNIFVELASHMPEENYFTNCFAFLLNERQKLASLLLYKILNIKIKGPFKIRTQEQLPSGAIDICIEAGSTKVFIENKVGSPVNINQLKKYKNSCTYLILIVKNDPPQNKISKIIDMDVRLTKWEDIWETIKNWRKTGDSISTGFLGLMEEKGMEKFEGFSTGEYGKAWKSSIELYEGAREVMKHIQKEYFSNAYKINDEEKDDYLGFSVRFKNVGWRFYYSVDFELMDRFAYFSIYVIFQKTFREFLRDEFYEETEKVARYLEDDFSIEWDRDMIYRDYIIAELLKKKKTFNNQIKQFSKATKDTLHQIEKSGLMELLKKANKEYK